MRDPRLTEFARANRREMTEPERRLWHKLRANRFMNIKFRKQKIIGHYIADFSCREPMLVIEVDGETHGEQASYDRTRSKYMEKQGYQVIRFTNRDVMNNLDDVLQTIAVTVNAGSTPLPSPLRGSSLSPEGKRET